MSPQPSTLVPAEPISQPERPTPNAARAAWIDYHQAMASWLRWQDDMDHWRVHIDERQTTLESRQDELEARMEGVEELSRLFVEVTERFGPQTLTPEHQATIKAMATPLHDVSGIAYAAIYGELNAAFHVGKYSDIVDAEWERVTAWFQARIAASERRRSQ